MSLTYLRSLLVVVILSLLVLLPASQVMAQSSSQAITIIPPRFTLLGNPGDSIVDIVRVRNESDNPLTLKVLVRNFSTSGEEGQVVIEEGEDASSFDLASWIEPATKEMILQPKQEMPLQFTINIPKNAEPGGHYASILFQSGGDNPIPGSAVVSQRIASLILLRVSGTIVEDASVESFEAPSYLESGPVTFTLRVKNNGNVHIRPEGMIVITNMFNQKVAQIPLEGRNVIPGAIRRMDTVWEGEKLFGKYKATLIASYGQGNPQKQLTAVTTFTVASKTHIILLIAGVAATIFLILGLIGGRKRLSKAIKIITSG